jgi:FtsH-binding integral membrane protein
MKTTELMKAGLGMKLIGIMVIFLVSLFLISPIFHIPDMISVSNTTVMPNVTNS